MEIKFSPPDITQAEIDEVVDTLKSGWITTGPKTKAFEKIIANYCHTPKAVCLNSATAGLELTLKILGIGAGDEVITSAYTYTASASVIAHTGATIVLCDVAKDSYEMDYNKLPALITKRTKAVIAVDIGGKICDYAKIFKAVSNAAPAFCPNTDLQKAIGRVVVIADAAHSFGAVRDGKLSGEIADFSSFSFHAVKNLTTAEGGATVWRKIDGVDDEWLYKQFMLWSLHGQSKDALAKTKIGSWEYDIMMCGHKCNMTDIMASLGLAQFKRYPQLLARRKQIVKAYDAGLKDVVHTLSHYDSKNCSSAHLYLTRPFGILQTQRNLIIEKMANAGIATNVHYKPLPLHTAYKNLGFKIEDFPNAYAMYSNEITLPLHTLLTDEQVDMIIENYREIIKKVAD